MWQELCKTRKEYLERAKLDTKGYSPRRSETLLYEIARLDGMDIKKQDFFNILNDIEISPKVTGYPRGWRQTVPSEARSTFQTGRPPLARGSGIPGLPAKAGLQCFAGEPRFASSSSA